MFLASQTRLERATPGLGGSCSIQLSYWDIYQKYSIFLRPRTRTNCRLGGDRSILLSYGTSFSKVLILQDFRGSGDCSPWCLGVVFANQEGRFLIGFSNFGGRIFSHLLILTLRIRSVGLIPFPGRFRTLRPFSVSGKAVVGLFLRRRTLYPAEVRDHVLKILISQGFRAFRSS